MNFEKYNLTELPVCKYRTRLYQDGVEVEPIRVDENYDFNFQETRLLKEERQLHKVFSKRTEGSKKEVNDTWDVFKSL